jgi:hypothetical protein
MQGALFALVSGQGAAALEASSATNLIVSDGRASADERLHVYAHMYRARMIEALESEFPRLAHRLGPEAFGQLAQAYVADHPSRHPSLRSLGRQLPRWLGQRSERRADGVALSALARLEWARADVFDEVDQPILDLAALRALPAAAFAALPLRLITASRLVAVDAVALDLWDAFGSGGAGADDAASVSAAAQTQTVHARRALVWRQGTAVYHRPLDDDEGAALERMAGAVTFGAICEALAEALPPEAASARAFAWLSTWATDELLAAPAALGA